MDRAITPKKVVNKACQCCRICKSSFDVKYGTGRSGRLSTENLFTMSNRDGKRGEILAAMCEEVGLPMVKSPRLSSRVCNPCARKIRNMFRLFKEIKHATEGDIEVLTTSSPVRSKRQLPTTVSTPDRSPSNRKVSRTIDTSKKPSSRKSLFAKISEITEKESVSEQRASLTCDTTESARRDLLFQHMNVDDLVGKKTTMVRVVTVYPSGEVDVRTPIDKQSKNLVRNIAQKKWKEVAHGMFGHEALKEEIPAACQKSVAAEFKEYCRSDSILKGTEPDQLAGFSSKLAMVLEEIKVMCPLWNACMHGACGSLCINSIALCSAVAARVRNATMSALAYRISAVLFHAGVGYDDLTRLNRMGVCMSPSMVINLQRKMGEHFDAKVYVWKNKIEENRRTLALLEEVKEKQVPIFKEDDMMLETTIDLTQDKLKNYMWYQPECLKYAIELTNNLKQQRQDVYITDETLSDAIRLLKQERLPSYK